MSDFFLPEIAALIGKDARTLRRWCISGVVPGAVQTKGGHWRIKAKSMEEAAGRAIEGARPFARNRGAVDDDELCYGASKRQPVQSTMSGNRVGGARLVGDRDLRETTKDPSATARLLTIISTMTPEWLGAEEIFDSHLIADMKTTALAWLMSSNGQFRPNVEDIAQELRTPRRTFYRKYGKLLMKARRVALTLLGAKTIPRSFQERSYKSIMIVEKMDFDFSAFDSAEDLVRDSLNPYLRSLGIA